jgi:hypothetical protein
MRATVYQIHKYFVSPCSLGVYQGVSSIYDFICSAVGCLPTEPVHVGLLRMQTAHAVLKMSQDVLYVRNIGELEVVENQGLL